MGFEPQTFRPTVRRANHCATGAGSEKDFVRNALESFDPKASKRILRRTTQRGFCTAGGVLWKFSPEHFTTKERKFSVDVVEVLLYVDILATEARDVHLDFHTAPEL